MVASPSVAKYLVDDFKQILTIHVARDQLQFHTDQLPSCSAWTPVQLRSVIQVNSVEQFGFYFQP